MKKPGAMVLSSRMVEQFKVQKDTVYWDRYVTGFGVRIYPSGSKVYIAQARGPGGPKRVTIGRHGVINADEARRRAALVVNRIKLDEEAVPKPMKPRTGPTVAEAAARYLAEHVEVRCKPKTAAMTRSLLRRHILPALGGTPLLAVERAQVAELHQSLCETPTTANRTVGILSSIYRHAERWGLVPEGEPNPCLAVVRFPKRQGERFLTDEEFIRLGRTLDEVESGKPKSANAVAAIRLLALTGCRKSEILTLRWENVALEEAELRLPDSKTGARVVSLPPQAVALLAALPRTPGNPWVFPGKLGAPVRDIQNAWAAVRSRAGLDDVRLHDLRHSFASRALAMGESLPMIGRLLGHSRIETTARYAHLARDTAHEAAERVAMSIEKDILGEEIDGAAEKESA